MAYNRRTVARTPGPAGDSRRIMAAAKRGRAGTGAAGRVPSFTTAFLKTSTPSVSSMPAVAEDARRGPAHRCGLPTAGPRGSHVNSGGQPAVEEAASRAAGPLRAGGDTIPNPQRRRPAVEDRPSPPSAGCRAGAPNRTTVHPAPGVPRTPSGTMNSPGPSPRLPIVVRTAPSDDSSVTLLACASATAIRPSAATSRPLTRPNASGPSAADPPIVVVTTASSQATSFPASAPWQPTSPMTRMIANAVRVNSSIMGQSA